MAKEQGAADKTPVSIFPPIEPHEDDGFVASPAERGDDFVSDGQEHTPVAPVVVVKKEEPPVEKEEPAEVPAEEVVEEKPAEKKAGEPAEEPAEEEPVEEKPAAKKEEAPKKKGPAPVPYDRFKEVNTELRAAQARLAEIQRQQQAQVAAKDGEFDFDAKEAEYIDLVLEGKKAEAGALRKEIRAAEQQLFKAGAAEVATAATKQATSRQTVQEITDKAQVDYVEFDPENEAYNDDLVTDVEAQFQGYMRNVKNPMDPAKAIRKAIDNVVKLNALKKAGELEAEVVVEEPKPELKPVPPKKDVKGKIEAAKRQPPASHNAGTAGASEGQGNIDLSKLSDEEFNALPAATIARMRGDTLVA